MHTGWERSRRRRDEEQRGEGQRGRDRKKRDAHESRDTGTDAVLGSVSASRLGWSVRREREVQGLRIC